MEIIAWEIIQLLDIINISIFQGHRKVGQDGDYSLGDNTTITRYTSYIYILGTWEGWARWRL